MAGQYYNLSPEEMRYYEDHGFLVIKQLIDFATLYSNKQRFIQICKGIVDKGNITVVKEPSLAAQGLKGEELINKLNDIHFDEVFMTFTENPRLVHVLSQFIGPEMRVTNAMFINKPPGSTEHPPHQDLAYFPFRPAEKIIAAWTAVDEVTAENGGLYVIPGSHKRGVLYEHKHKPGVTKLYHGILDPAASPEHERVVLEMSPGDTVFFHPLIVHGSGANITKKYRKSLTAHYASEECYYIDVTSEGPQVHLARDIEAEAKRRGFTLTFEEVWRYRSKHVDNIRSKL